MTALKCSQAATWTHFIIILAYGTSKKGKLELTKKMSRKYKYHIMKKSE